MGLYLGSGEKVKLILNGITHCLKLSLATPIINNNVLLSSDGYILKDLNGLHLVAKEDK